LESLNERIKAGRKTFMTTLYSEFLYASLRDREVRSMLNNANLAVADGIGVIWAEYFLRQKFTFKGFYQKIFQAWLHVALTGAAILLSPKRLYSVFPEKIVGADLVWDLAELASAEGYSIFLLGWPEQDTKHVAEILERKYPGIKIAGYKDTTPGNMEVLEDIRRLEPDMVLCAFGPLKQERWINSNLSNLPIRFAVGLGGTFDYMIGKATKPPHMVRRMGLEWLYRLFTQPSRTRRIFNGTFGLMLALVRYKVFESCSLRKNATAVLVNNDNKILIVQRNPDDPYLMDTDGKLHSEKYLDYWQFPKGGIEVKESAQEGAKRELFEEVGITDVENWKVSEKTSSYEWNNAVRKLFGNVYQHRGQQQHIVYFRHKGSDTDPKPDGRELIGYKWVSVSQLRQALHPELSELIDIIEADLSLEISR
jgi:N-acetylglucosaminyldiphosphoundecaprenol N-acetyl-beta-D-mannosaminyltransferase